MKSALKTYMDSVLSTCGKLRSLLREVDQNYKNSTTMQTCISEFFIETIFQHKEEFIHWHHIYRKYIKHLKTPTQVPGAIEEAAWEAGPRIWQGPGMHVQWWVGRLQGIVPRLNQYNSFPGSCLWDTCLIEKMIVAWPPLYEPRFVAEATKRIKEGTMVWSPQLLTQRLFSICDVFFFNI